MQMINPLSMAGWISNNTKLKPKAVDGSEMFMGLSTQKISGLDLIQNCDLPPPMKVFTGSEDKTVMSSMKRICSTNMVGEDFNRDEFDGENNEKLELFKALRLSQTRAREAEKKVDKLAEEKDRLCNAFLAEAKELFAYRQWVRLLELEVSKLEAQWEEQENQGFSGRGRSKGVKQSVKEAAEGENGDGITWIVALALCFGIAAGVGYAFRGHYNCSIL